MLKYGKRKMTSEKALQDKILGWLKSHRSTVWYLKVFGSGVQTGGVPDLLLCKKGKFIAIELKRPDGKGRASPRQLAQIRRIKKANGIGVVIDNYEDFIKLMEAI